MNPFAARLLLSAVALPTVYVLCAVLTGYHHLAMAVAVAITMAGGAAETGSLLRGAGVPSSRVALPLAAATIPVVAYLEVAGLLPAEASPLWISLLLAAVLAHSVAAAERRPPAAGLPRIAGYATELLYPALLGSYVTRIAGLHRPDLRYLLFFCLVFGNDISAYLAGRAAGGRTALGLKASPAKTAVGFAAGFTMAVGMAALFRALAPEAFPYPYWLMCGVGAVVAMATFVGDLAESALKRSAGVKDSGSIMLGRGGILDSVDSLVMSAPVYYLLFRLLGE